MFRVSNLFLFLVLLATPTLAAPPLTSVLAVDRVGESGIAPAADLLSVILLDAETAPVLRVSMLSLATDLAPIIPNGATRDDLLRPVTLTVHVNDQLVLRSELAPDGAGFEPANRDARREGDALLIPVAPAFLASGRASFTITTSDGDQVTADWPAGRDYLANCAFALHGNQGLGYTDVFHGRADDLEGSGFDEALQIHESLAVPVNLHLSGTLMTVADWVHQEGDPQDFNSWLADGVTGGWVGMLTSAYAQHIMPFVNHEMNNWAVHIETQMVSDRYGYTPTVAWVPERVWLNTSGYPSGGVSDWIGDNWQTHGVGAVILDDDVHLMGHDNHQIHTLSANGLRLIPRDRQFTGHIIGGNGQAALDILTGIAESDLGQYRIAVMAEDWEAVAEIGGWANDTPNANETYDWIVTKCNQESAWLSTWKLADAVANPDFTGQTFDPTPGTYWEIGGTDGYGGSNNAWYTHWAGWVPYANGGDGVGNCAGSGGNCKDYGTLWNEAYTALMAAPDNTISQAGWYVLMTMLYETGWHDGLGGPISGWEHNYSGHIKQAMIYAEASRWADGQYTTTTAAYFSDIDNDGYDEIVMHNDRLLAVFEAIGGRCTNLFVKGPGYVDTAIGVDNAYWSGTTADYNDDNHVGAFSDVSSGYVHSLYDLEVLVGEGDEVTVLAAYNEISKEFSLATGDAWLEAVYRVGFEAQWIQAGWSPSLVDLIWNAEMDRVWASDQAYMGHRNPNTGVTAAWVLGEAGAGHQQEFARTLMKGDEIFSLGTFALRLYAGVTSDPVEGEIAELRVAATGFGDDIGPRVTSAEWYPAQHRLRLIFDQWIVDTTCDPALIAFDEDGDDVADAEVGADATVVIGGFVWFVDIFLDDEHANGVNALDPTDLRVLLAPGAIEDTHGNACLEHAAPVTISETLLVAVDGLFEADEWGYFEEDDENDSQWSSTNEIEALRVAWDEAYLYIGLEGTVTDNSWLIYLDIDPGSGNGQTDLTMIDAWERGAIFTAPGFAADFQYGAYQHQSPFDSQGFWELQSPTHAQDRTGEVVMAFDPNHLFGLDGGTELAVPWHTLYGLGPGHVQPNASISLVASLCWDPEPDGELGGDSVPNNQGAVLPVIDNVWTLTVDEDGDGVADDLSPSAVGSAPPAGLVLHAPYPNPFNPSVTLAFDVPAGVTAPVRLAIFDARGRRVSVLVDEPLTAGSHSVQWQGRDQAGRGVAAGSYYGRLELNGRVSTQVFTLVK